MILPPAVCKYAITDEYAMPYGAFASIWFKGHGRRSEAGVARLRFRNQTRSFRRSGTSQRQADDEDR